MKNVIEPLLALQELEMGPDAASPDHAPEIARLRQLVPAPILAHYDRLRMRGKKGVALVRHGVCVECHMRLASGVYAEVIRAEDIHICGSCGRYLIIPKDEPQVGVTSETPLPEPPKPKTRKKKKAAPAGE